MKKGSKHTKKTKDKLRRQVEERYRRPELKPLLEELYITYRLSTREIAEQFGLNCMTIRDWLIKLNIPLRTISEANRDFPRPSIQREKHWNWKGGRYLTTEGYIEVWMGHGKKRKEHLIIAEKALGRKLKKGEVVHHVNGKKADNRNCNLLICTQSYHMYLHDKMSQLYMEEHFS